MPKVISAYVFMECGKNYQATKSMPFGDVSQGIFHLFIQSILLIACFTCIRHYIGAHDTEINKTSGPFKPTL
jgi:hypothetical protein